MSRLAGPLFISALALASTQANAQASATPSSEGLQERADEPGEVCGTLEQAALENALPVDFFVRVIWQESRFNANAVSPKGAAGIAQFMPRTAEWRGLSNRFDVIAALKASASYLRDLRNRFGNLGLAAAAYNAGPQRVQDWLFAQGALPKETRRYVQIVTGHSAEEWAGRTTQANLTLPDPVPCRDVAGSMNYPAGANSDSGLHKVSSSPQTKSGWGVQLVGSSSQAGALASFQQLQRSYKSLLETCQPLVIQSRVGTSGFWYRVRVATETRTEADKLCSGLRAAGGSCLVQRN
jgi:hypothetical protein